MDKARKSALFGFLCLLIAGGMFFLCLNQPYLFTGFRLTSSDFRVTEIASGGAAWCSGFQVDDVITRINDIDTADFAARNYQEKRSVWYSTYSSLFKKGELYRCEIADGSVRIFRVPNHIPFFERVRFIATDDKVCYGVGTLFIILGIVLSLIMSGEMTKSSFAGFLYATGLCLVNACSNTRNSMLYSILNLTLFQFASAGVACFILRIVAYFYRLAGRKIKYARINIIGYIPFVLSLIRFVFVAIKPASFFDSIFFFLPYVNLLVVFYAIIRFCILMCRIPGELSHTLRFFLLGIFFGLAPVFAYLFAHFLSGSLPIGIGKESLFIFMPMLFGPVSLLCAFIQTKKPKLDVIVLRVMTAGCSVIIISILIKLPIQSELYTGILFLLAPFLCFLLEKPVSFFLYPRVDYVSDSFNDLEKILFACDKEDDMYALAADWLCTALNASFIVFYEMPDETWGTPGKTLHMKCADTTQLEACLVSLIAERRTDEEFKDQLLIHETWGISAPIYKAHHVFGYVFIGTQAQYEMFSNREMRLIQPVTRILMEALLVLDLKQQVEYINNMQNRIVYSFADMIESRDGTTGQHVKRTSLVVDLLTRYLKKNNIYSDSLKGNDYSLISLAAPLHDIGKIKVPDRILSKPGKLTEEEFEIIKTHPVVGEKIINKTMFKIEDENYLTTAREMALYHHEKWDGSGYPKGLKGKKIPISARIMAVADVFDALCSARSYKAAFTIDEAFDIIDKSSGTHFEPVLVDAMHALRGELTKIYDKAD